MRIVDEVGMRETRREVVSHARGRTIEIGSGTGSNMRLYPAAVEELILTEPDPHMLRVLRAKMNDGCDQRAKLVQASAEELPFEDSTIDCVTCTMVLCTTPEPARALAEVARVLRPGGKLLFLEHVKSEDPGFARAQDRWQGLWRFLADGCNCNRDALATIESSPLTVEEFKRGQMPLAPLLIKPLVYGSAVLA